MDAASAAGSATRTARREVADWVPPLARAGYAAKGVVYIGVGLLSAKAAFQGGGQATGSREAIATMAREGWGTVVLWLIGIGLVGYVVWRGVQAILDPEDEGEDGSGLLKRGVFAVSGIIYAGLALWTLRAAADGGSSGGGSGSGSGGGGGWTADLMGTGWGRWVVVAAGAAVVIYGFVEFWKAYRAKVGDRLKPDLPAGTRRWVVRSARIGLVARGVVFLVIGGFLAQAGWSADPRETRGLEGALQTLSEQGFGPWLMGAVALGLAAYGAFQIVKARYRRIGPVT